MGYGGMGEWHARYVWRLFLIAAYSRRSSYESLRMSGAGQWFRPPKLLTGSLQVLAGAGVYL
jgi:hypothetical protein